MQIIFNVPKNKGIKQFYINSPTSLVTEVSSLKGHLFLLLTKIKMFLSRNNVFFFSFKFNMYNNLNLKVSSSIQCCH